MLNLLALAEVDELKFAAELRRLAGQNASALLDSLSSNCLRLGSQKALFLVRILVKEGLVFAPSSEVHENFLAQKAAELVASLLRYISSRDDWLTQTCEVIRQAEPLPFALLCLEELVENIAHSNDKETLHFGLCSQIKLSAVLKPLYLSFARSDGLELLEEWNKWQPEEQAQWLNLRLQEHPEEAEPFLNLFDADTFDYRGLVRFVDPDVLSRIAAGQLALEEERSDHAYKPCDLDSGCSKISVSA